MLVIILLCLVSAVLTDSEEENAPPAQKCSIIERTISKENIEAILKEHNRFRAKIAKGELINQPSASNMRKLTWDKELALRAQQLADQCEFKHNDPAHSVFRNVGQNLFLGLSHIQKIKLEKVIKKWFKEFQHFSRKNINPFKFDRSSEHYTQIAWANTYKIGCGLTIFRSGIQSQSLFVCNYGPGGNIETAPMYLTGEPCSKCQFGCSTDAVLCN